MVNGVKEDSACGTFICLWNGIPNLLFGRKYPDATTHILTICLMRYQVHCSLRLKFNVLH